MDSCVGHWRKTKKHLSLHCQQAGGQWNSTAFSFQVIRVCFNNSQQHFPLCTAKPRPFDQPAKMSAGHFQHFSHFLIFAWDFHSQRGFLQCLHLACSHGGFLQSGSSRGKLWIFYISVCMKCSVLYKGFFNLTILLNQFLQRDVWFVICNHLF